MPQQLDKFSNNFKKSLRAGADLALELDHELVEPYHIFYGLILQKGSVGTELFTVFEIKPADIKNHIAQTNLVGQEIKTKITPRFSKSAKDLIQKSVQIAYINKHRYIGTEHLLAAIIQIGDSEVKKIFADFKIPESELTAQTIASLKSASKLPDLTETFKVIGQQKSHDFGLPSMMPGAEFMTAQDNALELFGTDLTSKKSQARIDPVIGRDKEIERIIQILSRRTKNNPIILGHPGVGKTAMIEGLAKRIAGGEVPDILKNKKIYTIDLTATVAGTMFRGEFESRVKQIIDEAKKRPEVILFIDEIHNIVGTGSASGSMDTANILKPALARGEIRCIGATTFEDYRKSIENDPALDRRFQPIKIAEPTTEEAKEILRGIKKYYEGFHQVEINETAIETAVTLSQKYLQDKFLPDKAIDLIDEACAAVKVNQKASPQEKQVKELERQLIEINRQKEKAITNEDFSQALELKREAQDIDEKLEYIKSKLLIDKAKIIGQIDGADVAGIIARITGIPAEELLASEKKHALNLDKRMKEQIIGQDEAVTIISDFIKRSKAGLSPEHKPLASFIFVGPSGVGKTHSARVLASQLFNDENSLIKIDMSEYSEKFNISKLIGAPAGYVGYKESGQLTEKVKHKPYSIVLFDEIEKANADIFDLLLQILEDGYLTDASGTKINFQNTIIIMTANIGSDLINKNPNIGFDSDEIGKLQADIQEKIIEQTTRHFKPEFINRLDKIVYFSPLPLIQLKKIVNLELEKLNQRIKSKNIYLEYDSDAVKLIAGKSHEVDQGARGIGKIIRELVETPLSVKILEDEIGSDDYIKVSLSPDKNKLLFTTTGRK